MQTLTKNADMAMYLAKEDGKNGFRFFTKEIKTQSIERLTLESALRRALERDQFCLHYQPKIDMASGQITGVEALLRWNHPELGTVSPGQFIPLAEETGLIIQLGLWVLNEACRQARDWQDQGLNPVTVAVNVSARQFADPDFACHVHEALERHRLDPRWLELELTESTVMQDVDKALGIMARLHRLGVRLSIDDFGSGYSSLAALKTFPFDRLKMDRSLVEALPAAKTAVAIASAVISLAKTLKLTVVAEGVESDAQLEFLRWAKCEEAQGYRFAKPLPVDEVVKLLK